MLLLVTLVIVFSAFLFSLAFFYFFRIYKQLKIRHLKPIIAPPGTIPASLEQHQELAFVLTHGVEAYNELRRERQRRERAAAVAVDAQQAQTTTTTTVTNPDGTITTTITTRRHADSSSLHSSSSAGGISFEAPPAYSSEPVDGDIGYGWTAAGLGIEQGGLFATQTLTGTVSSTSTTTTSMTTYDPLLHPLSPVPTTGSIAILLPPVYRYQAPTARSSIQASLVSTDNSPAVTLPNRNRRRSSQQRNVTNTSSTIVATRPQTQRQSSQTSQSSQPQSLSPSSIPLPVSPPSSPPAAVSQAESV